MIANRILLSGLLAGVLVSGACQTHAAPADLQNFGGISVNPSLAASFAVSKDPNSGDLSFSVTWLQQRMGNFPEGTLDQATVTNAITWLRSNWLEFPGQQRNSNIQETFVNPITYSTNKIVYCETSMQNGQPIVDAVDSTGSPIGSVTPASAAKICPPLSFGTFSAQMATISQIPLKDSDGKGDFIIEFVLLQAGRFSTFINPVDPATLNNVRTWLQMNWLEFPHKPNFPNVDLTQTEFFINPASVNIRVCQPTTRAGLSIVDVEDDITNGYLGAVSPASSKLVCP
jgi:hypothetical protein